VNSNRKHDQDEHHRRRSSLLKDAMGNLVTKYVPNETRKLSGVIQCQTEASVSKPETSMRHVTFVAVQYGWAISLVAISTFLTHLVDSYNQFRSALFFPAILLSAWYGGTGPGLVAVLLSTWSLGFFFLYPRSEFTLLNAAPYLVVFVVTASLVSWLSLVRRRVESQLRIEIAQRKLAENALHESQENLTRTEQFSLVMASHTDLEGRWLKVPPTLCKLLGYTEEELLGGRFHEFTHPDAAEADWIQCLRLIRGEIKSYDLEKRYIRKDGSIVWVYLNVSVVLDASGAPVHLRTYIRDITQHKLQEQALRQSEERYRTLAETAADVILTIDQTSTILFVNGTVEKTFGYTPAEIVGQKITALMPERMRHRHEEAMRRYLETGEKRISWNSVSLPGLHKNGSEINLDVSFAEMGTGDERFFSGILRDVTERKRTEEALRKSQAELAHVARVATLGEMSASIAHELNQPLAAVVTSASACLRWIDAQKVEDARRSASRAMAEGHRASEIIGRIRALAKKAPAQKDWLDVNETIQEVFALARSEIQRNNIALATQLSEQVPLILADRIQLQQVILNLVMNAIEAMNGVGEGPRELLIRSNTDESKQIVISVQDSGPGIDLKSIDHLFETFYTTKPQGLGMGLAISRSIIESHGGRLWATANAPCGAVFQFILPVTSE
jgi:PAS domain S-box-containing protein